MGAALLDGRGANSFTATVEQAKISEAPVGSVEEFWDQFSSEVSLDAAKVVLSGWLEAGHRRRLGPNHVVLAAKGPATGGVRTVVAVYSDGRVMVPFSSYGGQNSNIAIAPLTTDAFRSRADALFGFNGSERQARTGPGWLTNDTADALLQFCFEVADAYAVASVSTIAEPFAPTSTTMPTAPPAAESGSTGIQ